MYIYIYILHMYIYLYVHIYIYICLEAGGWKTGNGIRGASSAATLDASTCLATSSNACACPDCLSARCMPGDVRIWVGDPSTSYCLVSLPRGTQKVFIMSVCKSLFPHRSVNLSFMITNIKNRAIAASSVAIRDASTCRATSSNARACPYFCKSQFPHKSVNLFFLSLI